MFEGHYRPAWIVLDLILGGFSAPPTDSPNPRITEQKNTKKIQKKYKNTNENTKCTPSSRLSTKGHHKLPGPFNIFHLNDTPDNNKLSGANGDLTRSIPTKKKKSPHRSLHTYSQKTETRSSRNKTNHKQSKKKIQQRSAISLPDCLGFPLICQANGPARTKPILLGVIDTNKDKQTNPQSSAVV